MKAGIQQLLAAQSLDQQIGGAVIAHPDHLSGGFVDGEAGTQGFAGHPAGTAGLHLRSKRQRFVPAQFAGIEILQSGQQDRVLDRTGGWHGQVGLQGGVATVIEHQQEGGGLELALAGGQLGPALAQVGEFAPRLEAALGGLGLALQGPRPRELAGGRTRGGAAGQLGRQQFQAGAGEHPQADTQHDQAQQ